MHGGRCSIKLPRQVTTMNQNVPNRANRTRRYSGYSRFHPLLLTAPMLLIVVTSMVNCQSQYSADPVAAPQASLSRIHKEPVIRVRIARGIAKATISTEGAMQIQAVGANGPSTPKWFNSAITLSWRNGRAYIQPARGSRIQWDPAASINIKAANGKILLVNEKPYPGTLVAHVKKTAYSAGGLDLINHLSMEQYLPGVLAKELYRNWHPQAYRAQAIAARSYAIWEKRARGRRHYDLESTQASQAYIGVTDNQRASNAVRDTRGVVLAWESNVLPAFYSSACGGAGQDATAAFPNAKDMQPLRGRPHGGWCSGSPKFRWGPINRRADNLSRRLVVWGAATGHSIARLDTIRQIGASYVNQAGRPVRFTIIDNKGQKFELGPEQFRVACNYSVAELPKVTSAQKLLSSHVQVRFHEGTVQFQQGHGYGHGVGMCQWGAQAMASQGYVAPAILNFYYPGAQLVNAYN
jgi:stage II sporulation protein D